MIFAYWVDGHAITTPPNRGKYVVRFKGPC